MPKSLAGHKAARRSFNDLLEQPSCGFSKYTANLVEPWLRKQLVHASNVSQNGLLSCDLSS